jgi:O-antigen ligase
MTFQIKELHTRPSSGVALTLERAAFWLATLTVWLAPLLSGGTLLWSISALSLFGILALLLTLLTAAFGERLRIPNPLWVFFAVLLLGWIALSNLWTPYALEGWRWTALWTGVLGAALSLHVLATTRARHAWVLGGMLVAGVLAVGVALLQTRGVYLLPSLPRAGGQDFLTGPYYHPSHFSGYLIFLAALCSSLLVFTRAGLHSLGLLALLGAILFVNLKTDGSSIPGVFLAAGLPVLVWVWRRWIWLGGVLTVLALLGLAGVAYLLLVPSGQVLLERYRTDLGFRSSSVLNFVDCRRNVYRTDLSIWRSKPLEGIGIGQFYWTSSYYKAPAKGLPCAFTNLVRVNYAHNDYFQMATELGVGGLLLYLALHFSSVLRRPRSQAELAWISAGVSYALVGLYDSHLTYIPGTMMVVYALSALKLPLAMEKTTSLEQTAPTVLAGTVHPMLERDPDLPKIVLPRNKAGD